MGHFRQIELDESFRFKIVMRAKKKGPSFQAADLHVTWAATECDLDDRVANGISSGCDVYSFHAGCTLPWRMRNSPSAAFATLRRNRSVANARRRRKNRRHIVRTLSPSG